MKGYSSRNAGAIYARGPNTEPKIQNKLSFLRSVYSALLLTRGLGPDQQECRRSQSSVHFGYVFVLSFIVEIALVASPAPARAQSATQAENSKAVYKQANAPIERRIDDLLSRMTLEEKVRQLDLYRATALVDQHTDGTHAATTANFLPDKAQALFGDLGVGAIHDLNPTPEQANAIQRWVIKHNRLGIPALFIEEALHGFDTGTVFPAPINLASTWDPAADERNWRGHCWAVARSNRCGHDSCARPGSRPRSSLGTRRRRLRRGSLLDGPIGSSICARSSRE